MPVPELDILKPIDPSITSSDDYEIFTLSNATVVYQNNGKRANLLHAYADTPMKVEGRLEGPDRSQMKYLVTKPFKPTDIAINNVMRFSYGQTQDGETVIWALGAAGWFELRPTRDYRETFQDMVEAVEILYFITDIYNEPRKKGGGPTANAIYQEYAEDERFECTDPQEAAQVFAKHRIFLFMCFLNRAQGIAWSNTPLCQTYKKQFQKDWETTKARVGGKILDNPQDSAKIEPASTTKSTTGRTKRKDSSNVRTGQKEAPKKDNNWWEAAAIFEFMQKAVNQGVINIGQITVDRIAKLIVRRYEIEEMETARNVIMVHAQNLCYMMDHPRRKNIQYLASEPIYEELSRGHNLSAAETRRAESIELHPRKDRGTLKEEEMTSEEEESSSSGVETPRRRPPRAKKGGLSVRRPTSSKYSGKSKSLKRGKGITNSKPATTDSSASSGDDMNNQQPTEPASETDSDNDEIDTPTQALSPGKRKHVSDIPEPTSRKRAASESIDSPSPSTPSSTEEDDTAIDPSEPLPLRWRPSSNPNKPTAPAVSPPIVSTPLPDYTANGPGDSWTCTFDGCTQKVYGASTEVGRTLIHEHFEDHARGRQKEIGIVLGEEMRCRLPVNNLIKRIREMTEAQSGLFSDLEIGVSAAPKPIERTV